MAKTKRKIKLSRLDLKDEAIERQFLLTLQRAGVPIRFTFDIWKKV